MLQLSLGMGGTKDLPSSYGAQVVLANTYLNSQHLVDAIPGPAIPFDDHVPVALRWIDRMQQGPIKVRV
jgi:hypothetical protein